MILTCDKARWYEDSEGFWAAFRTRDRASAAKIAEQMDGAWVVEARKQPRRRSLDANAYLWVLLDKLAMGRLTRDRLAYREAGTQ